MVNHLQQQVSAENSIFCLINYASSFQLASLSSLKQDYMHQQEQDAQVAYDLVLNNFTLYHFDLLAQFYNWAFYSLLGLSVQKSYLRFRFNKIKTLVWDLGQQKSFQALIRRLFYLKTIRFCLIFLLKLVLFSILFQEQFVYFLGLRQSKNLEF